jgi:hypothetical protein
VYSTNVSPNGEYALDFVDGLERCVMRDALSGNELVEGGCGIESWSGDGSMALIWDTTCSVGELEGSVCVSGRYVGQATPTPENEDEAAQDVYVPGAPCVVGEDYRDGLTPSDATPIPESGARTPEYYAAAGRFPESSFRITFSACVERRSESRRAEVTWFKDGTDRSRFDVTEIVDDRKQFRLTYIVSGDDLTVCSERLGPYLNAFFAGFGDDLGGDDFAQRVDELAEHERACMSDPHRALFFFAPIGGLIASDVFTEAGFDDLLTVNEDVDRHGVWVDSGSREIAGHAASCYERWLAPSETVCLNAGGLPLYKSKQSVSMQAVSVDSTVSDNDFELPHEIKAEIGRCFPREDGPNDSIDLEAAVEDGNIEKAIEASLLTLDDLDCSWSEPLEKRDHDSDDSACGPFCCLGPTRDDIGLLEVRTEFAVVEKYRNLDPYESNHLTQAVFYDAGDGAEVYMDQVRAYWDACTEHTFEEEDGDLITMRARELETDLGDDSVSYLLTFNHNAYGDFVIHYARVGNLATATSFYDGMLGIRDPERYRAVGPAGAIMELAVDKLEALSVHLE